MELLITMTARVTSGRTAAPSVAIVLALALGLGLTFATGQERATSPWPVVPPESQGFDSGLLADLLGHVRTKGLPLHNLVLIRRGQLILDASLYPVLTRGSARPRVGDEEHHLGARWHRH